MIDLAHQSELHERPISRNQVSHPSWLELALMPFADLAGSLVTVAPYDVARIAEAQ
jgi:hypothetical protein